MHPLSQNFHLPTTRQECQARGWGHVDIILVTGDAYIDHPSFGVALIGRLLEVHGYRVVILPQPRYHHVDDFRQFGRPSLFFGITAGNLDSIVANYSGNGKVRTVDNYSACGNPWFDREQIKNNRRRPDRATLIYANLAKAAYKDVLVILGGIEASLRRFIHYDYKQERLRGSVLTDAKADLLVYGMGEKSIIEIAKRVSEKKHLQGIPGTCQRFADEEISTGFPPPSPSGRTLKVHYLPSWEEIKKNKQLFMEAERIIDLQARSCSQEILVQHQQSSWLVQYPSFPPMTTEEMDRIYEMPFTRKPHPATPDIPAYTMIRHSITIVRGCSGNCSFCAITRHQGPVISTRSKDSILREASLVRDMEDFGGTITDLGGPTANLYGTRCLLKTCKKHDCLYPKVCDHLQVDEKALLDVLKSVAAIPGIMHVFISSGLRMELLLRTPFLLEALISEHLPGSIKIAPEHTEDEVLSLMHKEPHRYLCEFLRQCKIVARKINRKILFTPYIITAHPGCTLEHTKAMAKKLDKLELHVRQFQDFTPTPGTLSTAMYVTNLHRDQNTPLFVPRNQSDKKKQRSILEEKIHRKPGKSKGRP
jgi:uncharacterized radical SAM protein YgiQ